MCIQNYQVYCWQDGQVYVVQADREHCRVIELNVPANIFFWDTILVNTAELLPCEAPVPLDNEPYLPETGKDYAWDSHGHVPAMPPANPNIELEPNATVTVVGPWWLTTRVKLAGTPPDGPDFVVFTHHLKRL
jgi:hypothetical protein